MTKQLKFLALFASMSIIFPVLASKVSASDKLEIPDIKEIPRQGGTRQYILDDVKYLVPSYDDMYLETAELTSMGPMGHKAFLISIKDLAYKVKDSKYKFDYTFTNDSYKISKGENYKADPYKRQVDKSENASLANPRPGKIIVDGKTYDIDLYNIDGNDFVIYSKIMEILYGEKEIHLSPMTDEKLASILKENNYTIVANWDVSNIFYDKLKGENLLDLYEASKNYKEDKIGFLSLGAYGNLYTEDEIRLGFPKQEVPFKTYQASENFFDDLNLNDSYLLDKDGKIVGKSYKAYRQDCLKLYEKDLGSDKFLQKQKDPNFNEQIDSVIGANFVDYALGNKDPKMDFTKDLLIVQRDKLKEALVENKTIRESAKFLLKDTPKTVKNIKPKLKEMIKRAESLEKKADKKIKEIDKKISSLDN